VIKSWKGDCNHDPASLGDFFLQLAMGEEGKRRIGHANRNHEGKKREGIYCLKKMAAFQVVEERGGVLFSFTFLEREKKDH